MYIGQGLSYFQVRNNLKIDLKDWFELKITGQTTVGKLIHAIGCIQHEIIEVQNEILELEEQLDQTSGQDFIDLKLAVDARYAILHIYTEGILNPVKLREKVYHVINNKALKLSRIDRKLSVDEMKIASLARGRQQVSLEVFAGNKTRVSMKEFWGERN